LIVGILNNALGSAGPGGIGFIKKFELNVPFVGSDFPNGLIITEYINGLPQNDTAIYLKGAFAPEQPFEFGGEQKIVKEKYAGSKVASAQVIGPEESDIKINGRFSSKTLKPTATVGFKEMRLAGEAYQELIDEMRKRGNLVRIQLGEFTRYGLIQACHFKLKTRANIDYEINFVILSEAFPDESRFTEANDDMAGKNQQLADAAQAQLNAARNIPTEMPRTIADLLNGYISDVATSISTVTSFVDGILSDVESVQASANRAIGLIRSASATIARTSRRIGAIETSVASLGSNFASAAGQGRATIKNLGHFNDTQRSFISLMSYLAALKARFAGLSATIPQYRHLVKDGDTLQKIAVKYYNNADLWTKIYDHNNLRDTTLTVGAILEIPRL
jgi:nucleoid-associated protein YgaU